MPGTQVVAFDGWGAVLAAGLLSKVDGPRNTDNPDVIEYTLTVTPVLD
jgi:hypothetical protein